MLDFRKVNKKLFNVTLVDDSVLLIKMPTKQVFEYLMELEGNLKAFNKDDAEQVNRIYELTAEIMSNNIQGKEIDQAYLKKIKFDIEDIAYLFNSYWSFALGIVDDPNLKSPQSQEMKAEGNSSTLDAQQNGKG